MNCSLCNTPFIPVAHNAKYCSYRCRRIAKDDWRKGRADYKDKIRAYNLQRNFGMSVEDYEELLFLQDNKCAICGITDKEVNRRFAVDHDHSTGAVRGLLCMECNRGLGAFDDKAELLEKAVDYLRKAGKL